MHFCLALILSFACTDFVHAESTRALGVLPPRPAISNEALIESASVGVANRFVQKFNAQIRKPADMGSVFFAKVSARHRAEYAKFLAAPTSVPKLAMNGHVLSVSFAKQPPIDIEWPNLSAADYIVGGVPFHVDLGNSMQGNYDNFLRLVNRAKRAQDVSRIFFALPRADALVGKVVRKLCEAAGECKVIIGMLMGSTVGVVVGDLWTDVESGTCFGMSAVGLKPWESLGRCVEWKTNHDLWAAKAVNTALANTMPEGQTIDWAVRGEQSCPTTNANGDVVFETWMREVIKVKNSKPQPVGDWFYFRGSAKNGQLVDGKIYDSVEESKDDSEKTKAQMILTLQGGPNKALQLKSVQAKNFDKKRSLDPDYDTINLVDANKPGYRDTLAKMQYLAEGAESWFESCIKIAANAQLSRQDTRESVQSMMNQPSPAVQPASGDSDAKK